MGPAFLAFAPLVAAVAAPVIAKQFGPKAPKPPKFEAPPVAEEAKAPKFADADQRKATLERRRQANLRSSTLIGGSQTGLLDDAATTNTSLLA